MPEHNQTPTRHTLQDTVESIESLSHHGFSRIGSIARLAIIAMESPAQCLRTPDDIKHALSTIWGLADDIETCISNESIAVGGQCRQQSDTPTNQRGAQP
ncbi:MAG: hypothetical protein KBT88_12170 [Gammaproteobacteria bacterium]|nr:hypothetical protein [Gammaproteobacteria bacterium]MBQ0840531.1 hypothetical protein [Gammaproteobacteria bacterium]